MKTTFKASEFKSSSNNSEKIIKQLKAIEQMYIEVGFFSESVYPDGTPIAAVAKWNNDGDGNNPERPFFSKGILIGRMTADSLSEEMMSNVISGNITAKTYATAIGEAYQDAIVAAIDSDMPPPNNPQYWERKMMKGLKQSGKKKFKKMKAEGKDYLEALKAMDEKYTSGKSEGKYKYKTGGGGSPKTLINQGLMRKAVTYKIKDL